MRAGARCWAEVDLGALRGNLTWIRRRVGEGVRILTVVKADAYGHGLRQIAAHLMQCGTDLFGVANLVEARAIRQVGRGWPVLMLGASLPGELEEAIRDEVQLTVSSGEELRRVGEVARGMGREAWVHLKVDTGMGRLGARVEDLEALARRATRTRGIRLEGLCTHFASAEEDAVYTRGQEERFREVVTGLERMGIRVPMVHACNSGGVLLQPGSHYTVVRPGLLVYGIVPPGARTGRVRTGGQVQPVLSLKCRVALVRDVPAGARLSYGGTFRSRRAMRVAVLSAGYGDGYPWGAGNRAEILVQGRRCRVLGRVTMDQVLVDVSALRRVRPGEEAVLIGKQGEEQIGVVELARRCGTIPWEILTGISYRVPRVYRGGTAA